MAWLLRPTQKITVVALTDKIRVANMIVISYNMSSVYVMEAFSYNSVYITYRTFTNAIY